MRSQREQQEDPVEPNSNKDLQILSEIEGKAEISQRQLSRQVGISLGLTNMLLRNLVRKGYVRATQAGWKRWVYALTPEGFSHKIRLTVTYISRVLDHYQAVRQTLREQLEPLALHEESRVAIYGAGELAELVYLGLKELEVEEIDIFAPGSPGGSTFLGLPVRDVGALQPERYDRVVVALLPWSNQATEELQERGIDPNQLVTFFPDGKARRKT